jgi:hypothetical protein
MLYFTGRHCHAFAASILRVSLRPMRYLIRMPSHGRRVTAAAAIVT